MIDENRTSPANNGMSRCVSRARITRLQNAVNMGFCRYFECGQGTRIIYQAISNACGRDSFIDSMGYFATSIEPPCELRTPSEAKSGYESWYDFAPVRVLIFNLTRCLHALLARLLTRDLMNLY